MEDLIFAVMLGVLQGFTEWLPISSSGHLVIAQQIFGIDVNPFFDIFLHVSTLAAVVIFLRRELIDIVKSVLSLDFESKNGRLAFYVVVASIPAGMIGFAFLDFFESLFSSLFSVGVSLLATGSILLLSRDRNGKNAITLKSAVIIGFAQVLAILPGVSRSGSTISAGLLSGVRRGEAVKFSLLLSIPAVIGATLAQVITLKEFGIDPVFMAVSSMSAAITGYYSIRLLSKIVGEGKFHLFAYYCFMAGALLIAFSA